MGLSKATKDFFIDKITRKIQADINSTMSTVDKARVQEEAENKFAEEIGVLEKIQRKENLDEQIQSLQKEQESLEDELVALGSTVGVRGWRGSIVGNIKSKGRNLYEDEIFEASYPDEAKEIARLEAMKDDIEGVILLATTETNLRERLLSVAEKYGVKIAGIENLL